MSVYPIYPLPLRAGQVALAPVPGRVAGYEADLSTLLHWRPDMVLTMTTQAELDRVGATDLGEDLVAVGVCWHHLPIVDFGAPGPDVLARWPQVTAQAADLLDAGGQVLIHCFGGCGRSGMVALRLMVEAGEAPDAALIRLRAARPCAVERDAQFAWAAG